MKKTLILFLMTFVAVGGTLAAEEAKAPLCTAGLTHPGHGPQLLQISYEGVPVGAEDRDESEMAKIGRLSSIAHLTVGENEIKAGCYPCGFSFDDAENYYFVIWVGEEQVKTKMKIERLPGDSSPCLMMSMLPAIDGPNHLVVIYGDYYSSIPIEVGDICAKTCKALQAQSASCCAKTCPSAKAGKCCGASPAGSDRSKATCPKSSEASSGSGSGTSKEADKQ
jgi:hypothetical protein